jgi:hypothetical protein
LWLYHVAGCRATVQKHKLSHAFGRVWHPPKPPNRLYMVPHVGGKNYSGQRGDW